MKEGALKRICGSMYVCGLPNAVANVVLLACVNQLDEVHLLSRSWWSGSYAQV